MRTPGSHLLLVAALTAAVAATLGAAARTEGATASLPNVRVPAQGAYLGAYVGYGSSWSGTNEALGAVRAFEAQIGRRLAIDNRFYGWTQPFPTALESADVADGRIPMITWKAPRLDSILNGSQDAVIVEHARALRQFGSPVFLRWAWEMNGNWTEWAGVNNETPGRHDGASKFVLAWRHIHELFAQAEATNVSWVWSPNGQSVPDVAWNDMAAYYPGDAYVDWIGFSAYNWGLSRSWSRWSSFRSLVAEMYVRWAGRKPLMVAETSSVGDAAAKARWLSDAARALERGLPRLKAVVLFQSPPTWTLAAPQRTLAALRHFAHERVFTARGPRPLSH